MMFSLLFTSNLKHLARNARMVKKSLSLVYRIAKWLTIACVLIVLVVALAIHFYVFPNIDEYKNKIASFASAAIQQKVEIGNIQADWLGLNPHLTVANIVIYDAENRPALQLNNTDVTFSWLSIPKLEPHLAAFTIRAPELTIRRNVHGKFLLRELILRANLNLIYPTGYYAKPSLKFKMLKWFGWMSCETRHPLASTT